MWVEIVFWVLTVPLIIALFIVYFKSRKLYRLMYILSVFTYAMTVMYVIDAYDLGRNAILGLLAFSAALMMAVGYHFHAPLKKSGKSKTTLWLAVVCISIIAAIALLSALPIGYSMDETVAQSVSQSQVVTVQDEGKPYDPFNGPIIYSMTFTSTFMPRQYVLPTAQACLFDSETNRGVYLGVRWQVSQLESRISDFSDGNVIQLPRGQRTVNLSIDQHVQWRPMMTAPPAKPMPVMANETFDTIYLFLSDKDSRQSCPQCENLQAEDRAFAKKILVTDD